METIQPLIHKLLLQAQSDATPAQLLITIDRIRNQLIDSRPAADGGCGAVSVWLPVGFTPMVDLPQAQPVIDGDTKGPQPPAQVLQTGLTEAVRVPLADSQSRVGSNPMAPAYTPSVAAQAALQPHEMPVVYELSVEPETIKHEPVKRVSGVLQQDAQEQYLPPPTLPDFIKNSAVGGANGVLSARAFGSTANQVVSAPVPNLNEAFIAEPVLADHLATNSDLRVADLRKALTINEKYQYINHLFRGDEAMFERSLRTLNNFEILPEARYWMQRELVVKLGWTEEDELVQQFYHLVSRRFS
ncbi:MAG: hypothetical protein EAY75_06630 [Bacteroidetes bacterium]|nr:MAG: hypothetical protein EAY75_06630 [Bacteroidota bacterium]